MILRSGKNNNDQTYSCPRDWRHSASWEPKWGLKTPVHHSTIGLRGWRGALNWTRIMPWDISLSDTECEFFFLVWMPLLYLWKCVNSIGLWSIVKRVIFGEYLLVGILTFFRKFLVSPLSSRLSPKSYKFHSYISKLFRVELTMRKHF